MATPLLDQHLLEIDPHTAHTPFPSEISPSPPDDRVPQKGLMAKIGAKGTGAMTGAVATSLLSCTRLQSRPPPASASSLPSFSPTSSSSCCQHTLLSSSSSSSSSSLRSYHQIHCATAPLPTSVSSAAMTASIRAQGNTLVLDREPVGCASPSGWRALVEEFKASGRVAHGFRDELVSVWRESGVRGFWRGVGTTITMGVPSSAIYMVGYDHLRTYLIQQPSIQNSSFLATSTPLFAGSLARTFSATIISPVELFRTRLQAHPPPGRPQPTVKSTVIDLRKMVGESGVRSLWRGIGATLWRDVPFSGIYWGGYEWLKGRVLTGPRWEKAGSGEGEWGRAMVAGAGSGMFAALVTTPFDVLKTRRQITSNPTSSSLLSTSPRPPSSTIPLLREIIKNEGFTALFAGLVPRLAKVAPACAIMVSCYEVVGSYMSGD
ncbi:Mitochondrial carrier protein CGI-69 [Phaffia rhodozyma]|uniref:Mitochondrial carrier protein CGI-69 n=1 Tax=Phaffia rhodozyma TaxID=264483 RepID=A0A0F7SWD3_PHARH|nr:Mitochondrial carrier protein CGI-69 [Phaffia rhodozyma]